MNFGLNIDFKKLKQNPYSSEVHYCELLWPSMLVLTPWHFATCRSCNMSRLGRSTATHSSKDLGSGCLQTGTQTWCNWGWLWAIGDLPQLGPLICKLRLRKLDSYACPAHWIGELIPSFCHRYGFRICWCFSCLYFVPGFEHLRSHLLEWSTSLSSMSLSASWG